MTNTRQRDYTKGKVYKIEALNSDEGDIYIGSTTKEFLSQRMVAHRSKYRQWLKNKMIGELTSFQLFQKYGVYNCYITLIENVNASSRDELLQREKYYIKSLNCVNKCIPTQTRDEYKTNKKEEYNIPINIEKRFNAVCKFAEMYLYQTNDNNDFVILSDLKIIYTMSDKIDFKGCKISILKPSLEVIMNEKFIKKQKINNREFRSVMFGWKIKINQNSKFFNHIEILQSQLKTPKKLNQ